MRGAALADLNEFLASLADLVSGGQAEEGGTAPPAITGTLETNLTPPIPINLTGAAGEVSWWMRLVQPTITGQILGAPVTIAPAGRALAGVGTVVFFGVLGLAVYGAVKLFR